MDTGKLRAILNLELPWWLSGKEPACQSRRLRFNPCVRKIPRRRKWKPTPVFLPGEFHGQKGAWRATQSMGLQIVGHNLATKQQKATEERQGLRSTGTKASLWEMLPNLKFRYGRINSGFPKFGKNSTNLYDNINNDL